MQSFCPAEQPRGQGGNIQTGTGGNHKSAQRKKRDVYLLPKADGSTIHHGREAMA